MSNNCPKPSSSLYNKSKVFINPNFNKCKLPTQQCSTMYINPYFNQQSQHILINPTKTKIHVNPNFVKVSNIFTNTYNTQIIQSNIQVQNIQSSNIVKQCKTDLQCKPESSKSSISPIQKSRYSLIRKINKEEIEPVPPPKPATAIKKISKYKLVAIPLVNKLMSHEPKPALQNSPKNRRTPLNTSVRSKFKYVKRGLIVPVTPVANNKMLLRLKKGHKLSPKLKLKILPGSLKKNNIPCPLFRKYGMCLRKLRGSCEFLHDPKHVSICKRFLRGACHDTNCLLSHDLTDKKMPTCYFYLNGMCTKEKCPYVHIKLNEKTKVCSDFLKGYCEKGDQCLKRHVNIRSKSSKKLCPQTQKNKAKKDQKYKIGNVNVKEIKKTVVTSIEKKKEDERRYYAVDENVNTESNECNDLSIKPSRCKLGTLPSYIKL